MLLEKFQEEPGCKNRLCDERLDKHLLTKYYSNITVSPTYIPNHEAPRTICLDYVIPGNIQALAHRSMTMAGSLCSTAKI